jgi:hypothetical protein
MITALQMIENLRAQLPDTLILLQDFSYLVGFYYVGHGLWRGRNALYDARITKESVISQVLLGACLIVLPSFGWHAENTLFTGSHHSLQQLAYTGPGGQAMSTAVEAVEYFVQVVGWIAIVRGLMILREVGNGTAGQGVSAKKGVTHILGGGLATVCVATAKALGATFGLTLPV